MEEQPKSYLRLGRFVLILFVLIFLSSLLFKGPFAGLLNWSTFNFVFRSQQLSQIVQNNLSGEEGDFAVFIEDLTDGENFSLRGSDIFPSASLYKLYLMAAVLKEIEDGRLKMEDEISSTKSHLVESYGELDFGYEEAPENISYTIEEALTRIGRVSDNFASIMLTDKIGLEKIQQMADLKDPFSTSASDMGTFFKKLYNKEIVSTWVCEKLAEFLSLNQLNDRIPAQLPKDVKVIHKTGELGRLRHDAGMVCLGSTSEVCAGRVYVIVLLSQNLKYEDKGVEALAQISKEVYEYFKLKR